jgi:hypothetical protein
MSSMTPAAYLQYLQSYEKNMTRLYDEGRYGAFEEKYSWIEQRVQELNQSGTQYRVAVNQFADWTKSEISDMFPVFKNSARSSPPGAWPEGWEGPHETEEELPMLMQGQGQGQGQQASAPAPSDGTPSWTSALNWASDKNPLQMAVVAGPRNQGVCGACWAFVAAGSAEGAVGIASKQPVSALSVQQLIDCATEFNRGCNGGNPVYAYDYIRENGLSLSYQYPYDVTQNPSCHSTRGFTKAYINYDLEIPPNDEVELKWYVGKGPVAIGICGEDMDFMYYGGGIFNPATCCGAQNHAMLVVGYGVEPNGGTPYWLVQNSWGPAWGEEGYMRIKRSTVRGVGAGVCGLATFPTMAVGGSVLQGNSTVGVGGQSLAEWLLGHNSQIVSLFAAVCFLFSIALLIATYWFSCRRRGAERSARERTASRIMIDVMR